MFSRRHVLVAAWADILVFGIAASVLGSLLPALIGRFGLDEANAGSLFPMVTLGIGAGSLVFGPIVDRYGYKALLVTSVALVVTGLEGIAWAPSVPLVGVSLAFVGFGGGVINGATSALVADVSEGGRTGSDLAVLGVFFGIGAVGTPLTLSLLLSRFDYAAVTAGIGAAVALPLLYTLSIRFPPSKHPHGFPLRQGVALLRDPAVLLVGTCLLFESGLESIGGGWIARYVQEAAALPADGAILFVSIFWGGLLLGRLLMGFATARLSPAAILYGSMAIALLAALLLVGGSTPLVLGCASALLGLGFASAFPLLLAYGGERYPTLSGTLFGILFVMALFGGTGGPWVTGLLGNVLGLRTALLIIPTAVLCMAMAFTLARHALRRPVPETYR